MPTLASIAYSPWSLRARLALRALGVRYRHWEYTPTLSELRLRWALGRWRGKVTVPVLLLDDGTVLDDSYDIVMWADAQAGHRLIPPGSEAEVRHWNDVAERLLATGRLRTTARVLASPEALRDSLPPPVGMLGPLGMAIGRDAARRLLDKYAGADELSVMTEALDTLRQALTRGEARPVRPEDRLLGDRLTYADLTAAVGLSFVKPHRKHPLSDSARVCWTEPELVDSAPDLLAWRDAVTEEVREMAR